jgi:chromate transporter
VALISLPFVSILFLASIYEAYIAHNPALQLFLDGVAVSAVGLLLSMAVRAVRVTRMQGSQLVIMGLVAFAVGVLRWPLIPVILVLAPVSVALVWPRGGKGKDARRDRGNA